MIHRLLLVIPFVIFLPGCLSKETCSNQDRSCSVEAQVLSLFSAPEGIYLYPTTSTFDGNFVSDSALLFNRLQSLCQEDRFLAPIISQTCGSVIPFVSTPDSNISDFTSAHSVPGTGVPVRGPFGAVLANSWGEFYFSSENSILVSLTDAGLGTENYWTFSDSSGFYISEGAYGSCNGGTTNIADTEQAYGYYGSPVSNTTGWVSESTTSCNTPMRVLCLCYTPGPTSSVAEEGLVRQSRVFPFIP